MIKITPGTWRVEKWSYDQGQRMEIVVQNDSDAVATVSALWRPGAEPDDDSEQQANARLIAAAPEILAALQAIARDCREVLEGRELPSIELIYAIANGKARTAIAKATGKET